MATIAYGEITILDLIDTATYIYYSKNANGSGATIAPQSDSKYIGIYSGPPVSTGQPATPPSGTIWSKYVGEQGEQGEKGDPGESVYITYTAIHYVKSEDGKTPPTSGWETTIPEPTPGWYLWTKATVLYSTGDESISYSVSYYGLDGDSGNAYYIETNQEEILRFYEQDGYLYSPNILTFKIFEYPKQTTSTQISLTSSSYRLELQKQEEFYEIKKNSNYLRLGFIQSSNTSSSNQLVDSNTVYFNLSQFYTSTQEAFQNGQVLRFSYLINGKVAAIKIIQLRNGVSEEMAKFNIHANGINASIQSGRLSFSANGLQLYKEDSPVFWADNNGELWLKGNLVAAGGTFSGELVAAKGSFSGEIQAASGQIGGFTIGENVLYSGDEEGFENSPLRLYGAEGKIYASNITLGIGAKIEEYIELGDESGKVYIKNPSKNDGIFLESGRTYLTSNGKLSIGEIVAFGGDESTTSYIMAGNELNNFWKINGDGTARFREIVADKATIQNSILEIGTVQAVGSLMLFKDSWKIEQISSNTYYLETSIQDKDGKKSVNLKVGDFITKDTVEYYQIKTIEENKITFTVSNTNLMKGDIITKIGQQDDFLISILGDSNGEKDFAAKNSLTLAQVNIDSNGRRSFNKTLILGDLSNVGPNGQNFGTGLYAENVFLNGTLTTKIQGANPERDTYAGINTLNSAQATKFEDDSSRIVFWAGSKGVENSSIQQAKFQVTEEGSIYASQGIFEGSLITKSVIKGASIHAAEIYGEDSDHNEAALKIYDANRGILFMRSKKDNEVQLQISMNGLSTTDKTSDLRKELSIIKLDQNKIQFLGDSLQIRGNSEGANVGLEPGRLAFNSLDELYRGSINFTGSGNLSFSVQNNEKLVITQKTVISIQDFQAKNNIFFGEINATGALKYQKVDKGYDLYVS